MVLFLLCLLQAWRTRPLPLERLGLHFWVMALDPQFILCYDLEEIWFIGSNLNQIISKCSMISFCSGSRSCGTNFATTNFMPRSCVKISDTVVLGIPRSTSSSHCQLLTFVDCSRYLFNILRCSACCRPSRIWITFNRFSTTFLFVLHSLRHPQKHSELSK